MYEVQVWNKGRLLDTAFVGTLSDARRQAREFMEAYAWTRIELIYAKN